MKPELSVVVSAKDEAVRIADCVRSAAWADEVVVVVDERTKDDTAALARAEGARVVVEPWHGGFAAQKAAAVEHAGGRWVFVLDADERFTPALAEEVRRAVRSGEASAYEVCRKNHFGRVWVRHGGWWPDWTLRLFRRGAARFDGRLVHERLVCEGRVGRLRSPLLHYTYEGAVDFLTRSAVYAELAARQMWRNGRRARAWDILLRPPATFLRMYLLRAGFLDGMTGLALARLYAAYTLAKYHRLRELGRLDAAEGEMDDAGGSR